MEQSILGVRFLTPFVLSGAKMLCHEIQWWVVCVFFLPLWFLQNVIHEVSHGVMILPWGWHFRIIPYPHFNQNKFYFARVEFISTPNSLQLPDSYWSLVFLAPRWTNTLFLGVVRLLYCFVDSFVLKTFFLLAATCQLIDGLVGVVGIFYWKRRDGTDIWEFQRLATVNLWLLRGFVVVWIFAMVGLYLIILC